MEEKENTGAKRKVIVRSQATKKLRLVSEKNVLKKPLVKQIKSHENENFRPPLIDLDKNVKKNQLKLQSDEKLEAQEITKRRRSRSVVSNKPEVEKELIKKKRTNSTTSNDKSVIAVRKTNTVLNHLPTNVTTRSRTDSNEQYVDALNSNEYFVQGSKHYITFTSPKSLREKFKKLNVYISPIRPNIYTSRMTLISQGIPDEVRKPAKKTSLLHKFQVSNRTLKSGAFVGDIYLAEYFCDVIRYLLAQDWKNVLKRNFFKSFNPDENNRAAVIDWLNQALTFLNQPSNIFFAIVRLFDKLLATTTIPINMYQLSIMVIMWIITKLQDNQNPIEVAKILTLCHRAYSNYQFLKMERKLLLFFDFDLLLPDVTTYISYYLRKMNIESELHVNCSHYILECYALNSRFSTIPYSVQAAAAVCLSLKIVSPTIQVWRNLSQCLAYHSMEELENLMTSMIEQIQVVQDPNYGYRQPFLKYSTTEKLQVSIVLLKKLVAT